MSKEQVSPEEKWEKRESTVGVIKSIAELLAALVMAVSLLLIFTNKV